MSARDELKAALYGHPQDESLLNAYRAEVLREAIDRLDKAALTRPLRDAEAIRSAADELRRMADETAPGGTA